MSEVPVGLDLPSIPARKPRLSASLMLTRDGESGIEVLLCRRVDSLRAFPAFWSFPGGGLSRVDRVAAESLEAFDDLRDEQSAALRACAMRELAEELGWTLIESGARMIPADIRQQIVADGSAWASMVSAGDIEFSADMLHISRERVTPPFAPMRFHNTYFHAHLNAEVPEVDLSPQTEFDAVRWFALTEVLNAWNENSIKLPPPLFTLLRDLHHSMASEEDVRVAAAGLLTNSPAEREIHFSAGVICIPVQTATLPPASTTNCYLLGHAGGDLLLVDAAAHGAEDIEWIRQRVEGATAEGGRLLGIMLTHRHLDHVGDLERIMQITGAGIWCSQETADYLGLEAERILSDGEVIELAHPMLSTRWEVLITPGHCPGHICLLSDAGLVAGDMVAGYGTILIPVEEGRMEVYLEQLARLKALQPRMLFPSHGPVMSLPQKVFGHYIDHRTARQQRVLDAVNSGTSDLADISVAAYADTPDAHLGLARQQTLSHLLSLQRSGDVGHSDDAWAPIS